MLVAVNAGGLRRQHVGQGTKFGVVATGHGRVDGRRRHRTPGQLRRHELIDLVGRRWGRATGRDVVPTEPHVATATTQHQLTRELALGRKRARRRVRVLDRIQGLHPVLEKAGQGHGIGQKSARRGDPDLGHRHHFTGRLCDHCRRVWGHDHQIHQGRCTRRASPSAAILLPARVHTFHITPPDRFLSWKAAVRRARPKVFHVGHLRCTTRNHTH